MVPLWPIIFNFLSYPDMLFEASLFSEKLSSVFYHMPWAGEETSLISEVSAMHLARSKASVEKNCWAIFLGKFLGQKIDWANLLDWFQWECGKQRLQRAYLASVSMAMNFIVFLLAFMQIRISIFSKGVKFSN